MGKHNEGVNKTWLVCFAETSYWLTGQNHFTGRDYCYKLPT